MPKRYSKYIQSIAHHEAGHAIAAWSVGIRPLGITVVPDETSSGMYVHRPYFKTLPRGWKDLLPPAAQRRLENRVLVALAGGAAQKRFNPARFRWKDCSGDHDQVKTMLLVLTGGEFGEEFTAYWKLIEVRATNFVAQASNWYLIRAVARALLKHQRLSGRALGEIIDVAHSAYYRPRSDAKGL